MVIRFDTKGTAKTVYNEMLDLETLGALSHSRASHVEPDGAGWSADLTPIGGPVLSGFKKRSEALKAEIEYINKELGKEV